jgi:4-amino-4-deoxy-L-arabinose transferase-like glycosyltransferase
MGQRAWVWLAQGRRTVAVLFALALALRALAILAAVEPTSDAAWYFSRAAMLADGRGYLGDHGAPTAYWPPGWPLALSLVFRLSGPSIWAVGLFNLALAALAGWLTLALGRQLGGEAVGRLALLLWAVYPNAVLYVPLALTEVFYTTLLLALCWIVVARQDAGATRGGWGWTLLAGLVLGLATLVKAQSLILAPLLLLIAWLRAPALGAVAPRGGAGAGDGRGGAAGDRAMDAAQPPRAGRLGHGLDQWRHHPAHRQQRQRARHLHPR